MNFGVLLNKTISEWQGQNFPCYNKMNRNEARTVADQNVVGVQFPDSCKLCSTRFKDWCRDILVK